jgi:hypothetical protein
MSLENVTQCGTIAMATPEARVKAKLRGILNKYDGMYTYWPVPTGYGGTTLDVLGCYRGRFFAVETKALGKKPTLRQMGELHRIERAMGQTFVIVGEDSPVFEALEIWLDFLTRTVRDDPHLTPDPIARRAI